MPIRICWRLTPRPAQTSGCSVRPSEAVEESKESYATPIPMEYQGRSEIILVGGDCVTAHDAETGKEIWRAGGWNPQKIEHWRLVPSVVVDKKIGLVFACAPKNGPVMAIKDGGHGDVTATGFAWKSAKDFTSDVCVPLIYKDQLYVLGRRSQNPHLRRSRRPDRSNGRVARRPRRLAASPTGADDKIYCMNETGDVGSCRPTNSKFCARLPSPAPARRATIIVTDGTAILRVGDRLMAFGK